MAYITQYPPEHSSTYVRATSVYSVYYAHNATDPALSLIGAGAGWFTGQETNQKYNIDLGAARLVRRVYLENWHANGASTDRGIKNFIVYGTNSATAFANTDYADLTDLVELGSFQAAAHVASNEADPQYFLLSPYQTAYRYYVLRVADSQGGTYMGLRRIELQVESHVGGIATTWDDLSVYAGGLEMAVRCGFEAGLQMFWKAGGTPAGGLDMRFSSGYVFAAGFETVWRRGRQYHAGLKMDWAGQQLFASGLDMRFAVTGGEYAGGLQTLFDVVDRDLHQAGLQALWVGGGVSVDQGYEIGATMAGVTISPYEIRRRRSRGECCHEVKLSMAGHPSHLPGAVLPLDYAYLGDSGKAAAVAAATVVVTINGESQTLLATAVHESASVDGTEFVLVCESALVLYDAPYALPVDAEYGPGMAADIAAVLVPGISWQAVNWWIYGGTLYANGETPLEVLRKMTAAIGGMIQCDIDANVSVLPYYTTSKKDWPSVSPLLTLALGGNFFDYTRSDLVRPDYNLFLIGDQLSSTASLRFEEVDLERGLKEIRGYQVPWSDEQLSLNHSGGRWVVIEAGAVVTETIERELVEIVAGEGRAAKPIYRIIDRDYGNNVQLGAISYGEDGAVSTEIVGQSLVELTYVTRYWRWLVRDDEDEQVQLYSLPAWEDVPVTIVVTFGDVGAADGFVVIEADETLNVDDDGEPVSELAPGDPFYFLLQHDDTIVMDSVSVSSGSVAGLGNVWREKTQQVQMVDKGGVELPYINAADIDAEWDGRSPALSLDGRKLQPSSWPAIGDITYQVPMQSFRLTPPSMSLDEDEQYHVLVVIKMVSV